MKDFMKVIQHALIKHPSLQEVLVLQYSNFSGEFAHRKWALPGGHLKIGEDPIAGLKREVTEETGLEIGEIKPFRPHMMYFPDGVYRYGLIYQAELARTDSEPLVKISKEHLQYKWMRLEKINSIEYVNHTFYSVTLDFLRLITKNQKM